MHRYKKKIDTHQFAESPWECSKCNYTSEEKAKYCLKDFGPIICGNCEKVVCESCARPEDKYQEPADWNGIILINQLECSISNIFSDSPCLPTDEDVDYRIVLCCSKRCRDELMGELCMDLPMAPIDKPVVKTTTERMCNCNCSRCH